MREILFRGKGLNGEWLYGSLIQDEKNAVSVIAEIVERINESTAKIKSYEVDKKTIGQFTGFIDKNGIKIFEHDLVLTYMGLMEVCFSVRYGVWGLKETFIGNPEGEYDYRLTGYQLDGIEVKGNVFDNPELF